MAVDNVHQDEPQKQPPGTDPTGNPLPPKDPPPQPAVTKNVGFMASIGQWAASKGGWAHVVAAIFAGVMAAYAAVPQFHDLVQKINAALPGWSEDLFTTGLALYAWYKTTNAKVSGQ